VKNREEGGFAKKGSDGTAKAGGKGEETRIGGGGKEGTQFHGGSLREGKGSAGRPWGMCARQEKGVMKREIAGS